MTTYRILYRPAVSQSSRLLSRAWRTNRALTLLIIVSSATLLLAVAGMVLDPRQIAGQPNWAKTFKFSLSFIAYAATLLWLFSLFQRRSRWLSFFMYATATALFIELALIVTQALRGRMMHFNYSTPLDAFLYQTMATAIFTLWTVSLLTIPFVLRQRLLDPVIAWGLRLGFIIAVGGGFGLGLLMTSPTAEQRVLLNAGAANAADIIGGHTVGAVDGGPGLPILGWSTEHGDLRIGHFFGLHALQAIPLIALFLTRRRRLWLTTRHRIALVITAACAYSGWLWLLTWQALRAEPLLAPSPTTLAALALLIAGTAAAAGAIVIVAQRGRRVKPIAAGSTPARARPSRRRSTS